MSDTLEENGKATKGKRVRKRRSLQEELDLSKKLNAELFARLKIAGEMLADVRTNLADEPRNGAQLYVMDSVLKTLKAE